MKYNGAVAVLMPLIACAMTPAVRPSRPLTMMWIVAGMVGAFLLAAPYTFLDLPNFLNQFARLSSEYRAPAVTTEPVWQIYLKHLRNAYKWPGAALAGVSWSGGLIVVGGLLLGLWRIATGPERLKWTLLTVFPLVYFRFISNQNIIYGRYLLPLVPFLSILAAAAVVWVVDRLRHAHLAPAVRNAVTVLLALTTIAPSAYTSIAYDADAAKVWTTQMAYEWIKRELPAGTRIRLEGSLAIKLPRSYRSNYVRQLRVDGGEWYAGSDIDYLVASSQCYGLFFDNPQQYPVEYADYQQIFGQTAEVARFKPSDDHPGSELIILKVKR
jgi:hypothetical protein